MNSIIENLSRYGAVTDGKLYSSIDDDILYITCLDAFAVDERFDRLGKLISEAAFPSALRISSALLETSAQLELTPLTQNLSRLCRALQTGDRSSISFAFGNTKAAVDDLKKALTVI